MTPRPQTERILAVLADNEWHSFEEIKAAVGAPFSMLERRGELKRMGHVIERKGELYRWLSSERERGSVVPGGNAGELGLTNGGEGVYVASGVKANDADTTEDPAKRASRSENSQLLSPRPVASPPPSARRASPFWEQNTEWSRKV